MPTRKMKHQTPMKMVCKDTGMTMGIFFVCPICPPILMGLAPHPIVIYTDHTYAKVQNRDAYAMVGKTWDDISVLGLIKTPHCGFKGWIRKGLITW